VSALTVGFAPAVITSSWRRCDESTLREFARGAEMRRDPVCLRTRTGLLRALRVEGRETQVLVCREAETGAWSRPASLDQAAVHQRRGLTAGYLSGLRLDASIRHGAFWPSYAFLRECHDDAAPFYLTTIMRTTIRESDPAFGPGGLPRYHDFGRFCCMAVGLSVLLLRLGP